MADCLFCGIVAGDVPSRMEDEDELCVAFHDVAPAMPFHVLVVPRKHIATLNDLTPADDALVGTMARTAAAIAKAHGYDASGFRTVMNCNKDAGQTVFHIHLHLLAGRGLAWPPG